MVSVLLLPMKADSVISCYNLLSNAIKFTPEKGQVEIKARCIDNGELQISVRDTRIKKEHQEPIFSEFRQVEESYAR